MGSYYQNNATQDDETENIQILISVGADDIGLIQDNAVEKAILTLFF